MNPNRMLKKSPFSPAQPRHAETRLFPCSVLASFRPSTSRRSFSKVGNAGGGFSVRQDPSQERTAHTKCGMYLLGPSLAAALLDGPFEHPRELFSWCATRADHRSSSVPKLFFHSLLVADRHVWGRQAAGGITIWQPNSRTSFEGRRAYPAAPLVLPS